MISINLFFCYETVLILMSVEWKKFNETSLPKKEEL